MRLNLSLELDDLSLATAAQSTAEQLIPASRWDPGDDRRNALVALIIFLAAYALLALLPEAFDLRLEHAINSYANQSAFLDQLFYDLDSFLVFSGVPIVALVCGEWFRSEDTERRSRLLLGIFAAVCGGILSRGLQHVLPTHPRPFYDQALGFHLPSVLGEAPFNTWNSFPSDHAAVFFGLAAAITTVRPRVGLLAFLWLAFVESSRAYVGAHYPTDLIGGAALGAALVWLAQLPAAARWLAARVVGWARLSPSLFYAGAFIVSYQVATLFEDIRHLSGGIKLIGRIRGLL